MCRAPCGRFHLLFHLIFTTIPWHETNLPLGQSLPETKSNLIPLAALPQAQVSLAVKGIFAPVFSGPTLSSLVFPPCDGHYRGEGHGGRTGGWDQGTGQRQTQIEHMSGGWEEALKTGPMRSG